MTPKAIVCHISASTFGDAAEINEWHEQRGFNREGNQALDGIGYHRVILNGFRKSGQPYNPVLDGKIEEGRRLDEVGAQCQAGGMNSISLGVCCIGDPGNGKPGPDYLVPGGLGHVVNKKYMTRRQHASLVNALARLCKRFGLDPLGTLVHNGRTIHVLSQHSDHDPGKPFCASLNMEELRPQVAAAMKEL